MSKVLKSGCRMGVRKLIHKLFWSSVNIILFLIAIFMVATLWQIYMKNPTITTLISSTYPVSGVPFPGIAVCSLNKISKKRAYQVALEIANRTNRRVDGIMERMGFFGQLIDFDFDETSVSEILEFQHVLDMLHLSVSDIMRKVTVSCEELLRSCYWQSVEVSCDSVFFTRLTYEGYCCLFNYLRKTPETTNMTINQLPFTTHAGVENGLYFSVNNNMDDYFYTVLSSYGVALHVFYPTDYPDKNSGSLSKILATPDSENFIEITPISLKSDSDLYGYSVSTRNCLFDHERPILGSSIYSQSDCFVNCKLNSIAAMCTCLPFFIPWSNNSNVCTLADIPCLRLYKDKWLSYFPDGVSRKTLEKESQHSLRCEEKCYPPCVKTVYKVHTNSFPAYNKSLEEGNLTRISIYFSNRFSTLYLQDVVYHWFEILSNFGGIFGIFVGLSMISALQLSLFYIHKFIQKLFR